MSGVSGAATATIFIGYMNALQSGVALSLKNLPLKQTNLWPILRKGSFNMKMNIECRTVRVPAKCLPAGTYFRYKLESWDELNEKQCGVLLVTDTFGQAVNLYSGALVTILDMPYEVVNDVELSGWV